jgi:hypothetical protein
MGFLPEEGFYLGCLGSNIQRVDYFSGAVGLDEKD